MLSCRQQKRKSHYSLSLLLFFTIITWKTGCGFNYDTHNSIQILIEIPRAEQKQTRLVRFRSVFFPDKWKVLQLLEGAEQLCSTDRKEKKSKKSLRMETTSVPWLPFSPFIFYSFKLVAIYISILSLLSRLQPTTTAALLRGQRAGPRTRRNVFRCRPENAGCPCMTEGFTSGHCHRKMKHYRFHPPVAKWRRNAGMSCVGW